MNYIKFSLAILVVSSCVISCYKKPNDGFVKAELNPEDTTIVTPNDTSAFVFKLADTANKKADGASVISLVINVDTSTQKPVKVTFTTNKGTVLLGTVDFQNGQAISFLKLDQQPGLHYITAKIFRQNDTLLSQSSLVYISQPANPDRIDLQADKTLYTLTEPITIKTFVSRLAGGSKVSEGIPIKYQVFQVQNGAPVNVGRLSGNVNLKTNENGNVPDVILYTDDNVIDSNKALYIRAATPDDFNIEQNDTLRLNFKHTP